MSPEFGPAELVTEESHHISWIHGTSLHVQDSDQPLSLIRRGRGTRIEKTVPLGLSNWVHFAIPTTIPSGVPLALHSVILSFRTEGPAFVDAVEVFDGFAKRDSYDVHLSGPTFEIFEVEGHPSVARGIGVSVKVFVPETKEPASVEFWAAGAYFTTKMVLSTVIPPP